MRLVVDESDVMSERGPDIETVSPERPAERGDQHWEGYPDEGEVQSYVVPASARYGLLFAFLVLLLMVAAVGFMTMKEW
jgi:hypothetical protein